MFGEFRKFAMRGSVVDLSVGVIVGAAFTAIVNSLVKDIITPPLGWMTGGIDLANFGAEGRPFYDAGRGAKGGAITINYGLFINAVISFLLVAFTLFLLLRQINKLFVPKPAPPTTPPEDVVLLRKKSPSRSGCRAPRSRRLPSSPITSPLPAPRSRTFAA